jgi:predicted aminopeptidase
MFDESAATYVGSAGAVKFFEASEGPGSADAAAARGILDADLKFGRFLNAQAARLTELYASGLPRDEILKRRVKIFESIKAEYAQLKPQLSGLERFDLDKQPLDNAVLINYLIYFHDLDSFAKLERIYGGNLHDTIKAIIALAESDRENPFDAIERATRIGPLRAAATTDPSQSTPGAVLSPASAATSTGP